MPNNARRRTLRPRRSSSTIALTMTPRQRATSSKEEIIPVITSSSPRPKRRRVTPVTPEPVPSQSLSSSSSSSSSSSTPTTAASSTLSNNYPEWIDLQVPPHELRPSATLTTGQCFHWKDITTTTTSQQQQSHDEEDTTHNTWIQPDPVASSISPTASQSTTNVPSATPTSSTTTRSAWGVHNAQQWRGIVRWPDTGTSVLLDIQETPQTTLYRVLWKETDNAQTGQSQTQQQTQAQQDYSSSSSIHNLLRAYFQLDETPSLQDLYTEWSQHCPRMQRIAHAIPGVRILAQDPWECLISFICSSNNNIPRITQILQKLRQRYGTQIEYNTDNDNEDEGSDDSTYYYTFPSPQQLSHATEDDLRQHCGLGYRAKYIVQTTQAILDQGGEPALREWRFLDYPTVHQHLIQLAGVGPKVADCVALFSLRQDTHAIPVDTHVWNIALRHYAHHLPKTMATNPPSMTPKVYRAIQNVFIGQFPTKPAWAHSLLFVAELPSFRAVLPEDIVLEMDEFKKQEQEKKKQAKALKQAKKTKATK